MEMGDFRLLDQEEMGYLLKESIKTNEHDIIGGGDEDDIVGSGDVDDNIEPQPPSPDKEDSVNHNGWLLTPRL